MTGNRIPDSRMRRPRLPNVPGPRHLPQVGDLVALSRSASVQFAGERAILLSVIDVSLKTYTEGWCYLTGYEVNADGDANAKREVFVKISGLRIVRRSNLPRQRNGRAP
jgi:hypothetical protein